MEIRKIQFRKSMKFLTLLLTSVIIASASATVYFGLTMKSKVTTTAVPAVQFVSGSDSTAAGASISGDGTWVNLAGLKAYPNVTLTYEKAVNVSNTDTAAHNIRLTHSAIIPASGWSVNNFTSITFKLINVAGTTVETYAYTVSGSGASASWVTPSSTAYYSLPASTQWTIKVEIVTKPSATPSVVINIDMTLDVQQ